MTIKDRRRSLLVGLAIAIGGLLVIGLLAYNAPAAQEGAYLASENNPDRFDSACGEAFGEGWEANMWIAGNPPAIQCFGPNGTVGYMDMPIEYREQLDIVTPAEVNRSDA